MKSLLRWMAALKLFVGLLLIILAAILFSPQDSEGQRIFLDRENLSNVLRQVSNNGILAVGMTMVILTAGIDLSVGSVMAVGCTVTAMLLTLKKWTPAAYLSIPSASLLLFLTGSFLIFRLLPLRGSKTKGILSVILGSLPALLLFAWLSSHVSTGFDLPSVLVAAPAFCLLLGIISGTFVAYGKLQPFIVTLAMMTAALGAGRLISGRGGAVHPIYESGPQAVHASFWVLREFLGGILPMPGLIFLICTGGAYVILTRTRFGRHVYAVGGNAETARLSGISVARTQLVVYALSGLLSGLTGVLYAAQYRQGKPDAGSGAELDAIAAVVVGGTRLMGGRGSVLGTFAGVLMLGILNNVLSLRSVDTNIQLILKGIIIMGAVLLQEGKSPVGFLRSLISAVPNRTP